MRFGLEYEARGGKVTNNKINENFFRSFYFSFKKSILFYVLILEETRLKTSENYVTVNITNEAIVAKILYFLIKNHFFFLLLVPLNKFEK